MYDRTIHASPYPVYRRLRDEAPLYRNDEYDFFVVSRFDDVSRVLSERDVFLSGKGNVFNILAAGIEIPNGLFISEDPPSHTIHRALVSRLFTPRAVGRIEPDVHDLFHEAAESLRGRTQFDFMKDFAIKLPIRVIGMLFGLPAEDHADLQRVFHKAMNEDTADLGRDALAGITEAAAWFNDYLDHRAEHPTDDLMTQLLHMEFEDETGTTRKLEREEILTYLVLVVGAGSDTTGTSIGWAASLLADHPDQRRLLRDDPSLMASAIDEVLRYEPVSYHICRSLAEDVDLYEEVMPVGSTVVALPGSANRDDRQFDDADTFDIRREPGQIMTFSFGPHYCLGASLAKLEMRIALEAVLERFPDWTVDHDAATLIGGIDMRGWDTLPVEVVES
jgi:cytochrome P450